MPYWLDSHHIYCDVYHVEGGRRNRLEHITVFLAVFLQPRGIS